MLNDINERLRRWKPIPRYEGSSECNRDIQDAADEIERLRAQNDVLIDAITAASALMASAPAWHQMHRDAIAELQRVKKEMES